MNRLTRTIQRAQTDIFELVSIITLCELMLRLETLIEIVKDLKARKVLRYNFTEKLLTSLAISEQAVADINIIFISDEGVWLNPSPRKLHACINHKQELSDDRNHNT